MRGSRNFCHGEGRGLQVQPTEKNSDNVFLGISFLQFLQFYYWTPIVYFKENYNFLRFKIGSIIFRGGGPNFSRGCGVQMLISIETYKICDFPGGPGPPYPSGSAHAYDRSTCDIQIFKSSVKSIQKDRFFHAMVHFPYLERLVTPQNMMRYMILQNVSGKQIC